MHCVSASLERRGTLHILALTRVFERTSGHPQSGRMLNSTSQRAPRPVDKPMQGHGPMQAIARVNRVLRDKPGRPRR